MSYLRYQPSNMEIVHFVPKHGSVARSGNDDNNKYSDRNYSGYSNVSARNNVNTSDYWGSNWERKPKQK